MEIPTDLNAACVPLAWLLGTWEGAGVGDYPTIEAFRFGQEVRFGYVPGKPYLTYTSATWRLSDDGEIGDPLARETGYWRPQPDGQVEALLAHRVAVVCGDTGVRAGRLNGTRPLEQRGSIGSHVVRNVPTSPRLPGRLSRRPLPRRAAARH